MTASSRGRVVVAGLGPAGVGLLTVDTVELPQRMPCFLRTSRHPAAERFNLPSFDEIYESAATFDEVYRVIVERLVVAAEQHGTVGYLVPGSPMVAEHTVELLLADPRVEVEVMPAVSFLDVAWTALGIDPVAEGVELVDGHRFASDAAGRSGPMLVAQCHDRSVLSDIKLALDEIVDHRLATGLGHEMPEVTVLQRLGAADETIFTVSIDDLDRLVEPDHLTSVFIPRLATPVGAAISEFHDLVRTLRVECPWDREQTHESLVRFLIEETYEVVEAIDGVDRESGEGVAELEDELGDLLFQVVFHAVLGAEAGWFDLSDVARAVHEKLVRRHPHVFAPDEAPQSWEEIKRAERRGVGSEDVQSEGVEPRTLDGIPPMPPLARGTKVVRKVAAAGFDWASASDALAKLDEEVGELRAEVEGGDEASRTHELGDVVMASVVVAHHLGVDLDAATRAAIGRLTQRFEFVEDAAAAAGVSLAEAPLDLQLEWWRAAKAALEP